MNDLFLAEKGFQPLADRMRPRKLDQVGLDATCLELVCLSGCLNLLPDYMTP